jgi:hypothetical protein
VDYERVGTRVSRSVAAVDGAITRCDERVGTMRAARQRADEQRDCEGDDPGAALAGLLAGPDSELPAGDPESPGEAEVVAVRYDVGSLRG